MTKSNLLEKITILPETNNIINPFPSIVPDYLTSTSAPKEYPIVHEELTSVTKIRD